jgi:hypothetical protein
MATHIFIIVQFYFLDFTLYWILHQIEVPTEV